MKKILWVAVLIFYGTNGAFSQSEVVSLSVGDKAPKLQVIKWLNGEAVNTFQKDHVYIIEFSFVSCAPCRASIPHLTELQKKFARKATVISVYTNESNKNDTTDLSYVNRVEELITNLGNKINFTVAIDVPRQVTNDNWMKAAGESGFPTVFVVNKMGIVGWIGNPIDLDTLIMQSIIEGNFNEKNKAIIQKAENENLQACLEGLQKMKENGDTLTAFAMIDSLIRVYPENKYLYAVKFEILAGSNDAKAYALVQWMLDSLINFDWYHFSLSAAGHARNPQYFEACIKVADRAIEVAETKSLAAWAMQQKAWLYCFRIGDIIMAIKTQQKAMDLYRSDVNCSQKTLNFFLENLGQYIEKLENCQHL